MCHCLCPYEDYDGDCTRPANQPCIQDDAEYDNFLNNQIDEAYQWYKDDEVYRKKINERYNIKGFDYD